MITKKNEELVLRIPLWQKSYDAAGEEKGTVPNLIGFSNGKEFTINYLSDLGYKDSTQLGMPILTFIDKQELEEECKKLGLDIWEYDLCANCNKTLYGSFTMSNKGYICFDCEIKEKNP